MLRYRRLGFVFIAAALLCAIAGQNGRTQSTLRRITNTSEEGVNLNPSISGDGRVIAFESTQDLANAGGSQSFRAIRANVSVDPPTILQLGASRAPAPAVSQDGSRIAFASTDNPLGTNPDGNSEIFLHDGARLIQITNTTPSDISARTGEGNFQPSISDDGRFIAFSSNRSLTGQNADGNFEIYVCDTIDQTFAQLTNSSAVVGATDPKISGNGASVTYLHRAAESTLQLLLSSRNGSLPARVLSTEAEGLALSPGRAISEDGRRVVWSALTASNSSQVFLFDGRNGNTVRQITTLGARVTDVPLNPTISGDGTRIAFATRRTVNGTGSNSDGSVELYTFDIPSGTLGRVTNLNNSGATAEVISSLNDDGTLIAFNFPRLLSGPVSLDVFDNNSEIYLSGTPPRPTAGPLTVINGASFGHEPASTEAVAPGSIAVARGSVLAFTTQQATKQPDGTFPATIAGTSVTVNGRSAQIFFVSPAQINFLVPAATELGTAEVVITNSEGFQSRGSVPTLRAAPGIFTFPGDGTGEGVILKEDLTGGPFDPTDGNLRLIIFSTGVRNASQISLSAGGRTFDIESVIASQSMPGMDELHVRIPADLRGAGTVDLAIRADGRDSNPVSITFAGDSRRDFVINEFLADPPDGLAGDANGDGVRSASDDEFVELVNTTVNDIDISGYRILVHNNTTNADTLRHRFAAGSVLPACTSIVVFGGGDPDPHNASFGGAQMLTASSGSLSLLNSSGAIILSDPSGTPVNFVSYGGSSGLNADANQSVTRFPDINGSFAPHQTASGGARLFSPGTRVTGAAFGPCMAAIDHVEIVPSSANEVVGTQKQFTARAVDASNNEVGGVIFSWQSSNTAVATIDQHGLATTVSPGSSEIRALGRGVISPPAMLTVTPPPPVLTSVTIAPSTAAIAVGENQQFTAQAKDQTGQNIDGVAITFVSNDTSVATIDSVSATSLTGSATATVIGRTTGATEIRAVATDGSVTAMSAPANLSVESGAGQLLISEFRTRGPAGAADEFIEIYNPTTAALKIGGLKIRASNSSGTMSDRVTITAGHVLLPGCHYLVANSSASGYSGAVLADQTYGTGIADDGGIAITGSNGTRIIDAVGMSAGSAFKEGIALTPLTVNTDQSYERKPGGPFGNGTDNNNNAGDFSLTAPSNPQNFATGCLDTSSADLSITNTDTPDPVTVASNISYTLTVKNNGVANAQGVVVTDNLPSNVSFISCVATGAGVCAGSGNNRTITFASLGSGDTATVTLVVTANGPAGRSVSNTASISSATSDVNLLNNAATAETAVQAPQPTLSVSDSTAAEGDSGTRTFSFAVSLSTAVSSPITFDIATADATATSTNGDYVARTLTTQTIPAGQQTYTFEVAVNGDTLVEPDETFFVQVTNVLGATTLDSEGVGTIQNDDTALLVISQLYGGGGNSGASFTHDFIEVFNRGTTIVDLAGWSVQYLSATGSGTWSLTPLSGILLPGQYYLVAESSGGTTGSALPTPDATGSIAMAATAGKVALLNNGVPLTGNCPTSGNIIDLVGYGTTAGCFEGAAPAPAPSASIADIRAAKGCTDTNNNAADFTTGTPTPRNTATPAHDCNAASPPDLSINDVTATEGNGGTTTLTFAVTLSAPAPAAGITFDIATADNTATVADDDYVLRSLTQQSIASGQQTYSFSVTINGDLKVEPDETFFVNVTNASGANVVDGQANGTIQNDDAAAPPNISLNDVAIVEGNSSSTTLTFTASLSSLAPAGGVTFDISTQDDTATAANSDYVPKSLTNQRIPAGQQTYTFAVSINGDKLLEPHENFFVNLANVVNATVTDGQGSGTITNDDGIVISQVYGGGGNSGSTLRSDFIELFNRSTTTIDISAWSVQYIAATSTAGSYSVTNLCASNVAGSCTLASGQYFLVKLASGGGGTTDLPSADAAGTTDMSATAGKVAVVVNRTALSGATCQASAVSVADYVGYGTTANCFEGVGRAATPSATNATFRKGTSVPSGCQDTGDNAADFVAAVASPRNKLSPISPCP
jgi:uncharacterized protein (TIGR03437 family)